MAAMRRAAVKERKKHVPLIVRTRDNDESHAFLKDDRDASRRRLPPWPIRKLVYERCKFKSSMAGLRSRAAQQRSRFVLEVIGCDFDSPAILRSFLDMCTHANSLEIAFCRGWCPVTKEYRPLLEDELDEYYDAFWTHLPRNLISLDLHKMGLRRMPAMARTLIHKIQVLSLRSNHIHVLPQWLASKPYGAQARLIRLSDSPKLMAIPYGICCDFYLTFDPDDAHFADSDAPLPASRLLPIVPSMTSLAGFQTAGTCRPLLQPPIMNRFIRKLQIDSLDPGTIDLCSVCERDRPIRAQLYARQTVDYIDVELIRSFNACHVCWLMGEGIPGEFIDVATKLGWVAKGEDEIDEGEDDEDEELTLDETQD